MMKKLQNFMFLVTYLIVFSCSNAQDKSDRPSPPAQVTKEVSGKTITIDYSRPSKKGREVFGGLVKLNQVWRTGANETSWIEFSKDVTVNGQVLKAGKYGLFTIPNENEWEIIFNKTWDGWGAYDYAEKDDVLRIRVQTTKTNLTEIFNISIEDNGDVVLAWEKTQVMFSVR